MAIQEGFVANPRGGGIGGGKVPPPKGRTGREIWTYSRLKMWANCPMSEHLRYDERLAPVRRRAALDIGTAVHRGIETRSVDEAIKMIDSVTIMDQQQADEMEIATADGGGDGGWVPCQI